MLSYDKKGRTRRAVRALNKYLEDCSPQELENLPFDLSVVERWVEEVTQSDTEHQGNRPVTKKFRQH